MPRGTKRLPQLADENATLKMLLAVQMLDAAELREFLQKQQWESPSSARQSRIFWLIWALSEQRA
jgi:hypothetical protein